MNRITTLPVYSRLADQVPPELTARLPPSWRLSQHQVETYEALTAGDADVIFNTAMTGDGKSLAGQLPALVRGGQAHGLMAMYPTNELIADQQIQLANSIRHWQAPLLTDQLTSTALDAIMAEGVYSQRGDALLEALSNNDVILTNPDIFHLVMHGFYVRRGRQGDAPDKILGPLVQRFRQFTFDEYHILDASQITAVLNALLLIHETSSTSRPHRFLLLSATPDELTTRYLERSRLRVQQVTGTYIHSETPPDPASWRRILNAADIHIDTGRVEDWIDEHLDDALLPFFRERGTQAKGAIIVNSVAAAHRLLARLKPIFERHGLVVAPNTGLTSRARRKASYEADLLIGTSTVDVGVDFQINFLLFESRDAASFLQRLGRLGRHDGYERDGHRHNFAGFAAYALVPPWIHEGLFAGQDGGPSLLQSEMTVDRETLNQAIRQAYPPVTSFDRYAETWGKYQSVHVLSGLCNPTIKEQYTRSRVALGQRYEETWGIRLAPAFAEYRQMCQERAALWQEIVSFRGGSYFVCGLVDESEQGADRFKTTDLLSLAAYADLSELDEQAFYADAGRAGVSRRVLERDELLAFYRLSGWREERENLALFLQQDLGGWGGERFGGVDLLSGWELNAPLPGLVALNRRLCRRKLPCLLCKGHHPLDLKRRLRLPLLFALYPFESRDGIAGCVAFGRQALLLDTRLRYSGLARESTAIFL